MNDEKTAADYKVQGGSVLHLVLALRGGQFKLDFLVNFINRFSKLSTTNINK